MSYGLLFTLPSHRTAQFQIRELGIEHRAHSPNYKIASTAVYLRHLMIHPPQYHICLDITLYHNACILQLTPDDGPSWPEICKGDFAKWNCKKSAVISFNCSSCITMQGVNSVKFNYNKYIPRYCARWHNCKQQLLATSCLSARPGIFRKFDSPVFFPRKIFQEISCFIKIWQE
jgi:hypothetical protein